MRERHAPCSRSGGARCRSKKKPATFADAKRAALALPGVEEGTSYGTAALKVKGKFMFRLREDGETLAVKCGFDERDLRLRADPDAFFVTDHYRGYPVVLVRLAAVSLEDLQDVIKQAWRVNAPKKLVAAHKSEGAS